MPYLVCPACHATLLSSAQQYDSSGAIISGSLACTGCHTTYPITQGIIDFLKHYRPASVADLVNTWPLTAWAYERAWRPMALSLLSGEAFPYRRELALLTGLAAPARAGLFIDSACSGGLYARALAQARQGVAGPVLGVDHSLAFCHDARRRAQAAGLRISYARAKAQQLPVAPASAAGVVIGGSLNEIGDSDACLAEVRRSLAASGRFVMMSLASADSWPGRLVQTLLGPGGISFPTNQALDSQLARHGLRLVGRWQYGIVRFSVCLPA